MKKVIAYGITLVVSQTLAGLLIMKFMMRKCTDKEFIKNYTRTAFEVGQEVANEYER